MRLLLITLVAAVIAGCGFNKPILMMPEFPTPIKELTEKCNELKLIDGDQVAITDMLKTIVHNYTLYHQCSLKVDGWNEWYTEQKKIYDELRSKGKQ
jgi:hypothetical protein